MKTFGLVVPKGKGGAFEKNVRALLAGETAIAAVILPLLEAWRVVRARTAELDRRLIASVRQSVVCRLLMTMPGIGAVTAASYAAAVETPGAFARSRNVGAWVGLTPRRFQSGEVDYEGHISRRGDGRLRALLYEAATVLLTRVRADSVLRRWGLALKKRLGFKRAATAPARKMAVVLHAMWKSGTAFDAQPGVAAADARHELTEFPCFVRPQTETSCRGRGRGYSASLSAAVPGPRSGHRKAEPSTAHRATASRRPRRQP
jgi:transposase